MHEAFAKASLMDSRQLMCWVSNVRNPRALWWLQASSLAHTKALGPSTSSQRWTPMPWLPHGPEVCRDFQHRPAKPWPPSISQTYPLLSLHSLQRHFPFAGVGPRAFL